MSRAAPRRPRDGFDDLTAAAKAIFAPFRDRIVVETRPYGFRIDGGPRIGAREAQERVAAMTPARPARQLALGI